ncbi:uncharacterized protein LOC124115684 isoform X1 [Haliotis rufescens]|uniref:uncharacterized protein LOC124115684 isoform X1 n=1 Tax=Haliotis rufescens TaxID=6454 RepID=UPI00201FA536|nr:uncharacterized protein LOC124115684 isoform X1 [Haliotis rufescens]
MLSGGYSKCYQTLEREQVNHLKTMKQVEKGDIIARTRRLTQETNKRRKAQAQKRKYEVKREERRRQEILNQRHEEQQRATEKYQRSTIPSSRSSSRRSSPTHTTTGIEEALKLIRGTPPLSRQSSLTSTGSHKGKTSPRAFGTYNHDPLNRPYFNKYSSLHLRPQSPSERAQEHADLRDKSLRNYTDSRSLFEQQLEQHQQLLLEDQKKSLHIFNQAIQREMDADAKLEGTEEDEEEMSWMNRSDSLSSVDSLDVSRESVGKDRPQTASAATRSRSYPRPVPPKATPIVGRVAPNSASVNMTDDSLESKPFQVEYHAKPPATNYDRGAVIGPILNNRNQELSFVLHPQHQETSHSSAVVMGQQHQMHQMGHAASTGGYPVQLAQYPSHVTSNLPIFSPPTLADNTGVLNQPSTSAGYVLPSSLNQKHDYSQATTVSTLSLTNPSSQSSPSYTPAPVCQQNLPPAASAVDPPPSNPTPVSSTLAATVCTTSSRPRPIPAVAQTGSKHSVSSTTPSKGTEAGNIVNGTLGLVHGKLSILANIEAVANGNQPSKEPGVQTTKTMPKKSASDFEAREVKGILKRPEPSKLKKVASTGNLQNTGLRVKDSIEVARGNHRSDQSRKGKGSGKKSVRFADLQYDEDIPEDNDSVDSNTDSATPVKKVSLTGRNIGQGASKAAQRQRPVSAKVSGSNRVNRLTRAASAGTLRPGQPQHAQDRPRAAAHIIAHSIEGNDYLSGHQDKKVTVTTNNFMGKVPVAIPKQAASASSQGVIYTANEAYTDLTGDVSSVLQKADSVAAAYQTKYVAAPINSHLPPDSATDAFNKNQPVYNENGLRIDRTPTDDEINWLWEKVRTCLNREPTPSEKKTTASLVAADPTQSRQAATVSNKYIDGQSLGLTGNTRVNTVLFSNTVQHRAINNMASRQKPASAGTGGYMRKFGLLQQRKHQTSSAKRITQPPTFSQLEPQESDSVQPNVTESMATFLAAEHFAGKSMSDSQVQLALEEAKRRQQEIRAAASRGVAGPSALSMEEQKLLESLEHLNDKLKISESKHQPGSSANTAKTPGVHHFVHSGGFRGHPPISQLQRGQTSSNSVRQRAQSARHYH